MSTPASPSVLPNDAVGAIRTFVIFSSLIGIAMGIAALVWPKASLLIVGVLFGVSLIVTGLTRLFVAFAVTRATAGVRLLLGVLGGIVFAVGVLATINPAKSLVLLGVFIGVGWIIGGIQDLFGLRLTRQLGPRWLAMLAGAVSVVAGIAMITLPAIYTLSTILWILAVLLIAVSVVTLLTVPAKVTALAEALDAPAVD
ncbi:DUF308 domain-containing protein [Gordonia hydrophobica]|uniref:DUF308 domain-containing protein n=1 Tax=Gordonia hydrophobica TaxID=40516 RepID=A0ABZ2U6Z6_9ACTN|nr:DUF308 domain-containing protein [Gordonia hydrophobica]MBM7365561.1 uncharacterized membrane protein HdeD (DUF308 family) [Gordonia hydrophobica]